jgi:hypothetical protein
MTTSSCSSSPLRVGLVLVACLAAGCTDDGATGSCLNEDSPDVPGFDDAVVLRARVTLASRLVFDGGGARTGPTNTISASFTDHTTVAGDYRQPSSLPGGTPACYALTGTPTTTCKPGFTEPCKADPLDVAKVTVDGVLGGSRDLTKTSTGKYTDDNLADPIYTSGDIKVRVEGQTGKGFFPSFEQTVKAPDPLLLVEPKAGDPSRLGMKDLKITWKKGNGDFVVIEASLAGATGRTDKIQCVVLDDGCHTIYHNDLEFMDMVDGTQVKLLIVRKIGGVKKIDATTAAELDSTSIVEMVVNK